MRSLAILVSVVGVSSVLAQPPKAGTSHAFLVAVSGYSKMRELPFTVKEMDEYRESLIRTGIDPLNIKFLHDGATDRRLICERAKILHEFQLLLARVEKEDSLIVALNGPGLHFKGDETSYFCPIDADQDDAKSLIAMEGAGGLFDLLKECPARQKLLIVNACRNDPGLPGNMATNKGLFDNERDEKIPDGIAAIYSCKPGQESYYYPPGKGPVKDRSIFFHHLIEAWNGKYSEGKVTLEDVFKAVKSRTASDADRVWSKAQVPVVKAEYSGEWLITMAAREPKAGEERDFEIFPGVKMRFCWIPAGEAQLGSPKSEAKRSDDEDESKRRRFKTAGFWLGKYEVTQAEWKAVMGTNPSAFSANGTFKNDVAGMDTSRFPVEMVSWDDCQAFLKKCTLPGLKLPHEDEWEYACRGGLGNSRPFYFGTELNGREANCVGTSPYGTTVEGPYLERPAEVGSYEKVSRHPWGLCDMHGNVWEWCESLYYGSGRVDRGGGWSSSAGNCRAANRYWGAPTSAYANLGLRVARVSGRGQ